MREFSEETLKLKQKYINLKISPSTLQNALLIFLNVFFFKNPQKSIFLNHNIIIFLYESIAFEKDLTTLQEDLVTFQKDLSRQLTFLRLQSR